MDLCFCVMIRKTTLLFGKERVSDVVMMNTEPIQQDKIPMREFREIARAHEKPSPKLQPMNNSQPMRIQQPL